MAESRTVLLEAVLGVIALRGLDPFTAADFRPVWDQVREEIEKLRHPKRVYYSHNDMLSALRERGWVEEIPPYRCRGKRYQMSERGVEVMAALGFRWSINPAAPSGQAS